MGVKEVRKAVETYLVYSYCEDCNEVLMETAMLMSNPPRYKTYCPYCGEEYILDYRNPRLETVEKEC